MTNRTRICAVMAVACAIASSACVSQRAYDRAVRDAASARAEAEAAKADAGRLRQAAPGVAELQKQASELDELRRQLAEANGELATLRKAEAAARVLFDPGRTDLKPAGQSALKKIADVLMTIRDRQYQIAGHSDDRPIHTPRFEDSMASSTRSASPTCRSDRNADLSSVAALFLAFTLARSRVSETISVRCGTHEGTVFVEVGDSGVGIPKENLERIFEPFFTTKAVGVGTGLGLWICHNIVGELGGRITVESEIGKGTVFRVALPASQVTPVERDVSGTARAATSPRLRVLVVDDEPLIGEALARSLSPQHDVVVEVKSTEALARLRRGERFDAILCDVMMPVLSGMALYAELEALAPDQAERTIFMTGGAFTPDAQRFLERVPNQHIEKPLDMDKVESTLARLAARGTILSAHQEAV